MAAIRVSTVSKPLLLLPASSTPSPAPSPARNDEPIPVVPDSLFSTSSTIEDSSDAETEELPIEQAGSRSHSRGNPPMMSLQEFQKKFGLNTNTLNPDVVTEVLSEESSSIQIPKNPPVPEKKQDSLQDLIDSISKQSKATAESVKEASGDFLKLPPNPLTLSKPSQPLPQPVGSGQLALAKRPVLPATKISSSMEFSATSSLKHIMPGFTPVINSVVPVKGTPAPVVQEAPSKPIKVETEKQTVVMLQPKRRKKHKRS